MTDKEQIKSIIKQYADKGKKMHSEAINSRGSRYNAGFWDGYECCAKGLLRELEDMQEECMYSKDNYTDKERKALCEGCEEECRFNKKEDSVNNGLDLGCGVIWKDEESVSEDLEEFINTIKLLTSNTALLTFEYGCREGANWQKTKDQSTIELAEDHAMLAGMEKMKEQMLAKAVDTEVKIDAGGYPYVDATIELYDYDKDIPLAKEGDKYKVILIKEG